MFGTTGPSRAAACFLGLIGVLAVSTATGQTALDSFVSGGAAQAWEKWDGAMQAILDRDLERAEAAFGDLLAVDPSPFRVALIAEYTVRNTAAAGAVLLFEQDQQARALRPNGQRVAELLETGREQMNEADDGFYFCQLGRFDVAHANFRALLDARPDPVALLEFTEHVGKRRAILIQVLNNPIVGEAVREVLKLLDEGELAIKADAVRIKENIARLSGPPRGFENAVAALKDSGEWGVPFLVQTLQDRSRGDLLQAILRCLPQIDRPALNPLVMALRMEDDVTKRYLVEVLGKLGYQQAVPYLLQLLEDQATSPEIRTAAQTALDALRARGVTVGAGGSAAAAFYSLAEDYYHDRPSLAADVRLDTANVWYWEDNLLNNVAVPMPVFNEIMCMRCCEETLRLDPAARPALALWLAANFRREAQLPPGKTDPTRPENYPPASYFAQSAGADVCLMTLARAVDDGDPAVALGAIDALQKTAGPASLVSNSQGRLPLAEALSFADRMVRVRAGLTLAAGRPTTSFHNHQNLMPVLSEALMLYGGVRNALIVDADTATANSVAAVLREQGFEVLSDGQLYSGLQKVRTQLPGVDVIFIASDLQQPDLLKSLQDLRGEFRFAGTPVVIITKPGDGSRVRELVRADYRLAEVSADANAAQIAKAVTLVSRAMGTKPVTPEAGAALAKEGARVLRQLALTDNPVFDVADAEPALLAAFGTQDLELKLTIAEVFGYLGSSKAQEAIAQLALDAAQPEDIRVKMFTALAEAAKRRGNLLGEESVGKLVGIAERDANMTIREAASRTLGALCVPGEPASTIIRNQYRG